MYTFDYQRPTSLTDATKLAASGAKLLAGGQTLLASMKLRLSNPETLADLGAIKELSGIRKEGITFSIQTFTAKFTAAISAALSGVVLMLMQYDGTAAVQSAEVAKQFWFYANWVPVLGAALCMPLLLAYKLRDKDVQIMADANEGRITREQAQSALSMQY